MISLFQKILDKDVPAIVVRALIFAYEEQQAWVKLGDRNSTKFKITNGTRQGSVLSPYLFAACYLDDLLLKMRKLGLGCHIYDIYIGILGYADDLCLLAPNPVVLQKMVNVCQEYAEENNLVFSTDPVPARSKTKCIIFTGNNRAIKKKPIKLCDKDLPWVNRIDHLGHVFQQNLKMNSDISRARASFMSRATDIREQLRFATPDQRMTAIQLYCCDAYIWVNALGLLIHLVKVSLKHGIFRLG